MLFMHDVIAHQCLSTTNATAFKSQINHYIPWFHVDVIAYTCPNTNAGSMLGHAVARFVPQGENVLWGG